MIYKKHIDCKLEFVKIIIDKCFIKYDIFILAKLYFGDVKILMFKDEVFTEG